MKCICESERVGFNKIADEIVQTFSESIDGVWDLMNNYPKSENAVYNEISLKLSQISIFICYSYADCVALTKLFLNANTAYEKSLLRGKLLVQLNEGFKQLYGFTESARKDSYWLKLKSIIQYFPGFMTEFEFLTDKLNYISKKDSWWKDERNAEVHQVIDKLYLSRHSVIDEKQVLSETMKLIDFFDRFNSLINRMHQACINLMMLHLEL